MQERPVTAVQSLTLSQLSRGESWRVTLPHSRPAHLFVYLTRGQGRAVIMGRRRGIGANNVLFVPADTMMSFDFGKQCFGHAVLIPRDATINLPSEPKHLRVREVMAQGELAAIIDAISREQSANRPFGAEAMEAHAGLLSVAMRRALAAEEETMERPRAAERLAAAYCALVQRDFRTGHSVADFAAALGVTPTHLTRTLRQTCGDTAADVLTGRVLHAARICLQDDDLPIQSVAHRLGFSSPAYFARFMQHHTAQTPSNLRRAAQGELVHSPR